MPKQEEVLTHGYLLSFSLKSPTTLVNRGQLRIEAQLLRMRETGCTWSRVAEKLGRKHTTCLMRLAKLQTHDAMQTWSDQDDKDLKAAYKKRKREIRGILAKEIDFSGDWKVIERKIFEYGVGGTK
jgi:hypothetical protein